MQLANPKREKFALLCARGLQTIDAYERAGYRRNSGNAATLRATPDVRKRIEELREVFESTNEEELADFLREKKISPAYIVREMMDTIEKARDANKFDAALKGFKDLGTELFGMFQERTIPIDKQNAITQPTTTINIEGLNQALAGLTGPSKQRDEREGKPSLLEAPRAVISSDFGDDDEL